MSLQYRLSVKAKIAIVVSVGLITYLLLLSLIFPAPIKDLPVPLSESEKAAFEKKFQYHGIDSCICEGSYCYFIRNGKKIKL
jgi:hypothetical protein